MKTSLWTVVAAVALASTPAGYGSTSGIAHPKAIASVEFTHPENFTDFKVTDLGSSAEQQQLAGELRKEINRLAGIYLPAGYRMMVRFDDIDLAGDFEPYHRSPWDQTRILREIYPPRLQFEYSVADADGNPVASGHRSRHSDFQWRLRIGPWSETQIEGDLMSDFFRDLSREFS